MSGRQTHAARKFRAAFFFVASLWWLALPMARAELQLLGVATIPADATDHSGLTGTLEGGVPLNRLAGFSGIEYSGQANRYFVLPDRGPLDGAVPFPCRLEEFEIVIDPQADIPVRAALVGTKLLKTEHGQQLSGAANGFDALDPSRSVRFDPEGVRRWNPNQLVLSDEYGPALCVFDFHGKRLSQLNVPRKFQVSKPAATPRDELQSNTAGRQPNAGFEGVAISSDGHKLFAIVQRPLIQDSEPSNGEKRAGLLCRLLEMDRKTSRTRELVYRLENGTTGVSELLAFGPDRLLVLERDSLGGEQAQYKQVVRIDLTDATDCSDLSSLPTDAPVSGVRLVRKQPFLNLLDPRWKIAGSACPEKFEGLTFGPSLPDGRRTLLITVDNDFRPDRASQILVFAFDLSDLERSF
jgi:hypothetical protein